MKLASFLQSKYSIAAILGISAFLGLLWTVGDGVVQYASYYNTPRVLGESTVAGQCLPASKFQQFLDETKKTVTLYAPDKTVVFPLDAVKSCFQASGCEAQEFSCGDGTISLNQSCVEEYFKKNPLAVTQTKVISGVGATAQVRVQDWTVNYNSLAEQLSKAVTDGIKYCQVTGAAEQTKQNLGNLQLVVSDDVPGVEGGFTNRFIEIDASKEKAYFWNEGVYQMLPLLRGARLPKEGIYHKNNIDLAKLFQSINAGYLERNTQQSDYVIVHN